MSVAYYPMNPDAGSYPPPSVPMLPVLGDLATGDGDAADVRSVFDDGNSLAVRSGRAAIGLCLRLLGTGPGDRVLLPSYHCASMVEPVVWTGAQPEFFHVDRHLRADLDSVRAGLQRRPRALIIAHYFGLPQPLRELVALCREHGVPVIEDCAHAIFGDTDTGVAVGAVGDFAIASLPKFFPTATGGLLRLNRGKYPLQLRPAGGVRDQVRAVLAAVEISARYRRGGALVRGLGRLRGVAVAGVSPATPMDRPAREEAQLLGSSDAEFRYFIPDDVARRCAFFTRRVWKHTDRAALAAARVRNWHRLVEGLRGVRRARLLHEILPRNAVPYMLPLLLDDPQRDFPELKRRSVPLWRWEDIAVSDCRVASEYRLGLLHVPCHQSLTADDLSRMLTRLCEVLDG